MKRFKVVVLGLDGATFDLLRPWVAEGHLPTLCSLLERGVSGELRSTIPPITGPAWTTFMTGKNPGRHGIFDWIYRHDDSYDVSPVTAHHCTDMALWSILSQSGRRVCVYNVPMTYPPQPINGLMISGMPAPSTNVTITYPPELLNDILTQVDEYILYPDPGQAYSDSGIDAFLKRLYKTTENRLKVLNYLRAKEDWDFLMVVFNGTDTVQHAMWKYMSPDHPQYDPAKFDRYGRAILDYFKYLDNKLASLVDSLDDDTVLIVMSDHGFGPFYKFIHVNNWLMQQGWMRLKPTLKARTKGLLFRLGFAPMKIYNLLMRLGLGSLKREVVRGKGQGRLKTLFLSYDDVDWSRTVAYSLGNIGQIYLNVRGREPQGIVNPGADYEKMRQTIMDGLTELRDPENGELIIEHIYRREDIYHGSNLERAPDIVFLPKNIEYFGFGEYEFGSSEIVEPMVRGISGTHRMNGILIIYGKPVKPNTYVDGASLLDLAPTILHLMGQPVPKDMDGRVLTEALQPVLSDPTSIQDVESGMDTSQPLDETELSSEDEAVILERLRNLGYVG